MAQRAPIPPRGLTTGENPWNLCSHLSRSRCLGLAVKSLPKTFKGLRGLSFNCQLINDYALRCLNFWCSAEICDSDMFDRCLLNLICGSKLQMVTYTARCGVCWPLIAVFDLCCERPSGSSVHFLRMTAAGVISGLCILVLLDTEIFKQFQYGSIVHVLWYQYWYDTLSLYNAWLYGRRSWAGFEMTRWHNRWCQSCRKKSPNTLSVQHGNERFY